MPRKFSTSMHLGFSSSGLGRAHEGFALHGIQDRMFGWDELEDLELLGFASAVALTTSFFFLNRCVKRGVGLHPGNHKKKQQNQQTGVREKSLQNFKAWLILLFFLKYLNNCSPCKTPCESREKSILMVKNPQVLCP